MDIQDASTIAHSAQKAAQMVNETSARVIERSMARLPHDPELARALLDLNVMVTTLTKCVADLSQLLTHDAIAQGSAIPDSPSGFGDAHD